MQLSVSFCHNFPIIPLRKKRQNFSVDNFAWTAGLEPATLWLTTKRSTIELHPNCWRTRNRTSIQWFKTTCPTIRRFSKFIFHDKSTYFSADFSITSLGPSTKLHLSDCVIFHSYAVARPSRQWSTWRGRHSCFHLAAFVSLSGVEPEPPAPKAGTLPQRFRLYKHQRARVLYKEVRRPAHVSNPPVH